MDPSLILLFRQYFQQINGLCYPPSRLLLLPDVQEQIFRHMFDEKSAADLPPAYYRRKTLKALVDQITNAVQNPDEEEVSDSLMEKLGYLSTIQQPSGPDFAQQKTIVTYTVPSPLGDTNAPTIKVSESRFLLGAGSNVGLRTWESCLRLGSYLVLQNKALVEGKRVIELGTGTGLLSILCAKCLGASHVLATDGAAHVVEGTRRNIELNYDTEQSLIRAETLDWTDLSELDDILRDRKGELPEYDLILGSDITYNLDYFVPLVEILDVLVHKFPKIDIIISAAVRNINTWNKFVETCAQKSFEIQEIEFSCPDSQMQTGFFHNIAMEIRLVRIKKISTGSVVKLT